MRHLTEAGWERLMLGLDLNPSERPMGEIQLWSWAKEQGSGFRLAVAFVLGVLNAQGDYAFEGLAEELKAAHPVRLAFTLDDERRALIADFLRDPHEYVYG